MNRHYRARSSRRQSKKSSPWPAIAVFGAVAAIVGGVVYAHKASAAPQPQPQPPGPLLLPPAPTLSPSAVQALAAISVCDPANAALISAAQTAMGLVPTGKYDAATAAAVQRSIPNAPNACPG